MKFLADKLPIVKRGSSLARFSNLPTFFLLALLAVGCSPQSGGLQEEVDSPKGTSVANALGGSKSESAGASDHVPPDSEELRSIVKEIMDSAYGANNFDASRSCWKYSFKAGSESLYYCMIGAVSKVSSDADGVKVYVQSHSDPQAEVYSQVDPGLEGLFFVGLDADKKVRVLASKPAIDMGQAGDCGCLDAKVIQVGPARYGWLSTTGGVWQGVQVTRYSLQVPVGSEIRDVSGIPRVSENTPDESIDLNVKSDGKVVAGMYPLEITRKRGDNVLETRLVSYDEVKGIYPWSP
ncbi:hypothetical protein [Xanthomonas hortorum]|nr:hypothetical protein [Xanthomonas hortorum]EGD20029.1 hypothetical protein XGA_1291 [Xanthomonas hortorum ATCC 19865]MCC8501008.1 hypothetical protein [Xanthomonas hortorum pv. gardneri]MCC8509270.1 hypothetical protein [Xanthomonas hortorum pv. gardneri]MCC8513504.1 hypothetical protein [Xanthomonas hortorum pv. gardneri]MCC8522458.1 hypothetical protein [Xanthomonas hortorum pv. gardneri]